MFILDLDGVLSPLASDSAIGMAVAVVGRYRIPYQPAVVNGLNALNRDGHVQLRWLTSWGEDARTFVAPAMGLHDFPLLDLVRRRTEVGTWPKHDAIIRCVSVGTRFAWVDDDLTPARQRAVRRTHGDEHSLLVRPDPAVGLTVDDIHVIARFLEASVPPA
ncbi:hypothetical protein IU11_01400 [Cellulosimicrobium sp. MM]|nr:HAD domain-containing protein [Cellulosimicrobium sp. MM]KFD44548.1 hypothetical protein IU11_01400 [Cellulosimicrobium sp. MM]